ncbi:MAG TPA: PEP-CTERM sorting domain-containing protein [Phycisphaerae bacterium]|nr:PEP-CTERM sorting domain-containing protein [Phycisphaerae bacterium]
MGTSSDIQVVDTGGGHDVGKYASLALDSAGLPRIAYYDYSHWHLRYAARNGSTWAVQRVTPGGTLGPGGTYAALALDSQDDPHIVYCDWYDTSSLMYTSWDGAAWTFETVDADIYNLTATSLKFDDRDNPYIAYAAYDSQAYSVLRMAWIPEPATLALVAVGAVALLRHWRRA